MKKELIYHFRSRLNQKQEARLKRYFLRFRIVIISVLGLYSSLIGNFLKNYRLSKKKIRYLEIGPGNTRIEGFETLNVRWGFNVDFVADASKKLPFSDQSFDLLYASHILEHIPWYQIDTVLLEWFRIIKNGGEIEIWVPNGLKIAEAFVLAERAEPNGIESDGWYKFNKDKDPCIWFNGRIFSYGDGYGARNDPNWHLAAFSERLLKEKLSGVGFRELRLMNESEVRGYDHGWINLGIKGYK